jgi:hypothetical protein
VGFPRNYGDVNANRPKETIRRRIQGVPVQQQN